MKNEENIIISKWNHCKFCIKGWKKSCKKKKKFVCTVITLYSLKPHITIVQKIRVFNIENSKDKNVYKSMNALRKIVVTTQ